MKLGAPMWLFIIVGAIVVLTLALWGSYRVLEFNPTSKIPRQPPPRVLCSLNELPYSQGAIVRTAHGEIRCDTGKWVAVKRR